MPQYTQYAIRVLSEAPVAIEQPLVLLDKGFNIFNVVTEDVTSLLDELRSFGVRVLDIQMMQQDPNQSLRDLLAPGESQEVLCVPTSGVEETNKT